MPLTRQELFEESKKKPSIHTGMQYKCSKGDIWDLLHPELIPGKHIPKVWTPEQSTTYLETTLSKPLLPWQRTAVARLVEAYSDPNWSPDIVYKSFADFDKVFFAGQLRGHVGLVWADHTTIRSNGLPYFYPHEQALAICPGGLHGKASKEKCEIILHSERLLLSHRLTAHYIGGVLLHEMIHAYLHLTGDGTLHDVEEKELLAYEKLDTDYARYRRTFPPMHGYHFDRVYRAVNKLALSELGFKVTLNFKPYPTTAPVPQG